MDITLNEEVNLEKLQEVIDCNNLPMNSDDDLDWFNTFKKNLRKYKNRKKNEKGFEVKYTQTNKFGRYISNGGLQNFQKDVRKYISSEYIHDLDFENCHLVLLKQLFKKRGLDGGDFLKEYTNNKAAAIKKYNLKNKMTVIKTINNEQEPSNTNLKSLHDNIYKNLLPNLLKDDILKNIFNRIKRERKRKGKDYNHYGSFISHYLQDIENKLLMPFYNFLIEKGIKVHTLMFDGLTIEKTPLLTEYLLKEAEEVIFTKSGYRIRIVEKSTATDWKPIKNEQIYLEDPTEYSIDGSHTDVADLFKKKFASKIIRCNEQFYIYNENTGIWKKEEKCLSNIHTCFGVLVNEIESSIKNEDDDYIKKMKKEICFKLKNVSFKNSVISELNWKLNVEEADFNNNPYLLAFNNGVIDLKNNGIFRPAKYEEYVVSTTGYNFKTESTEKIEEVLKDILPDSETYEYVLRSLGSYLPAIHNKEEFFVWYGKLGANGKSTIIDLLNLAFGNFFYSCRPQILLEESSINGDKPLPSIMNMKGKRLVNYQEPPKNKVKIEVNTIKKLTGGDNQCARSLYGNEENFKIHAMHIMCCNELPILNGTDGGIKRRIRAIEFTSQFVENPTKEHHKKIRDINKEELKLPLVNLLIKYYFKWVEDKRIPEKVWKTTLGYLNESNNIALFLEKYVEKDDNGIITKEDIRDLYKNKDISKEYEFYNIKIRKLNEEIEQILDKQFIKEKMIKGKRYYNLIEGYKINYEE
jgi:P4 family phage/plasmid primase-like protien